MNLVIGGRQRNFAGGNGANLSIILPHSRNGTCQGLNWWSLLLTLHLVGSDAAMSFELLRASVVLSGGLIVCELGSPQRAGQNATQHRLFVMSSSQSLTATEKPVFLGQPRAMALFIAFALWLWHGVQSLMRGDSRQIARWETGSPCPALVPIAARCCSSVQPMLWFNTSSNRAWRVGLSGTLVVSSLAPHCPVRSQTRQVAKPDRGMGRMRL